MFDAKQESVSRRGFLGFAGVAAAGLAGATALSGCSPRTSGGKDSKSGEVAGINGVSGHEREGLPSFLIAPEPITDISETLDYDVVVVGAGSAGIPAALSACEAGAKVALLQRRARPFLREIWPAASLPTKATQLQPQRWLNCS